MLPNPFTPAKKEKIFLRAAIIGTSGSGKTWTAMSIGSQLAALRGGKMAFIDTEGRSARKYADKFTFDVLDLSKDFSPKAYIDAINAAVVHGYAVIVVDSFTHAWNGQGGVLDIVDKAGQKMGGNKFAGWATGRPAQNSLAEAILNAPIDIIGTMRSKTEWALQTDPRTGKDKPVKVGLAPVQSDDFEYEFDVVMYMDMQHQMTITKTRCSKLDGLDVSPALDFVSGTFYEWLTDGTRPEPETPKSAKECLADGKCQETFTALCKELGIMTTSDHAPYFAALGNLQKYSDFEGTFEALCEKMRAIHRAINTPGIDPLTAAAAGITTEQAAASLGSGNKTPIGREPVTSKDPVEDAALNQEAERIADSMAAKPLGVGDANRVPTDEEIEAGRKTGSAFKRGLTTYEDMQEEQRVTAAHQIIDDDYSRALERDPS